MPEDRPPLEEMEINMMQCNPSIGTGNPGEMRGNCNSSYDGLKKQVVLK
jgi:hypothetical protein